MNSRALPVSDVAVVSPSLVVAEGVVMFEGGSFQWDAQEPSTHSAHTGLTPAEERRLQWLDARLSDLEARREAVLRQQGRLHRQWEALVDRMGKVTSLVGGVPSQLSPSSP